MKVFDTFMFFNEFDLLAVRLEEHDPFVDSFVIVQANRTFTGKAKAIHPLKSDPRYKAFSHKIIEVNVELSENPKSAWNNENLQREAQLNRLKVDANDIIYVSDLDEIISRDKWPYLLNRMKTENLIGVWQRLIYYGLNLEIVNEHWSLPKLLKGKVVIDSGINASKLRVTERYVSTPFPCGFHFSYLMPPDQISTKISSFSHQEFNNSNLNNEKAISDCINKRKDLFGRKMKMKVVPIDRSWPKAMHGQTVWEKYTFPLGNVGRAREGVLRLVQGIRHLGISEWVLSKAHNYLSIYRSEDQYNKFSPKTFCELISIRPKGVNPREWRRLIEFLSSVLPELEGWFSAKQCAELFKSIVRHVPAEGTIVEVGSWKGRSSVFASRAASISKSTLYCVDTWQGNFGEGQDHPTVLQAKAEDIFGQFRKNVSLFGCDNIISCKGDSAQVASGWKYGPIDYLFIDGSHDYLSVLQDLKSWIPLLKPKAVVCGDDWNHDEVPHLQGSIRRAFNDFFETKLPNLGIVERFWAHQLG